VVLPGAEQPLEQNLANPNSDCSNVFGSTSSSITVCCLAVHVVHKNSKFIRFARTLLFHPSTFWAFPNASLESELRALREWQ
jgi:hypothetical protein